MGEIGGNDYNQPFAQLKTIDEIRTYVPAVINITGWAINSLIELGAKTLVVPGIFPLGCVSAYLTLHQSQRKEDYDPQTGCIKWLNEFSEYHNNLLKTELDRLRGLHPYTNIIYADYYEASMDIYRHPLKYGEKDDQGTSSCTASTVESGESKQFETHTAIELQGCAALS